ncbi:UNVERIFIED_CONTAM: hypothetical protein H355_010660, partial [Colinus virginianus]
MVLLKILRKTKQKERELRLLMLYKLNIWDVGGQKTIRSFWRNYFEETDGVVWVVDASDRARFTVCREELHKLMKEEVGNSIKHGHGYILTPSYSLCRCIPSEPQQQREDACIQITKVGRRFAAGPREQAGHPLSSKCKRYMRGTHQDTVHKVFPIIEYSVGLLIILLLLCGGMPHPLLRPLCLFFFVSRQAARTGLSLIKRKVASIDTAFVKRKATSRGVSLAKRGPAYAVVASVLRLAASTTTGYVRRNAAGTGVSRTKRIAASTDTPFFEADAGNMKTHHSPSCFRSSNTTVRTNSLPQCSNSSGVYSVNFSKRENTMGDAACT